VEVGGQATKLARIRRKTFKSQGAILNKRKKSKKERNFNEGQGIV